MARFPHIPREAVLKEDLLRTGFAFDESALTDNLDGEVKPKSYFIFSFDQKPLAELGEAAKRRPPEEVALTGGPYDLRRTIVSVRVNPSSPYRVAREDGGLRLSFALPRGAYATAVLRELLDETIWFAEDRRDDRADTADADVAD